jgi:glycosyltransferase involved in cell wall biosynthesis
VKVAFLIPSEGNSPGGGNKVVYEYANGLSARGHEVHVVHFAAAEPRSSYRTLRGRLRPLRYFPLALRGQWRPDNWFKLNPEVKVELVATPWSILMPKVDAYVATWWSTAERLAELTSLPGRKLYLIQHLETWAAPEEEVMATWKAPLEKIVIARWLEFIAHGLGESCHYIPNGFDFGKFGRDLPIEERKPASIAMLFNEKISWKGSAFGVAAVEKLKQRYPDLEVEFFGVNERPEDLPSWIVFHQTPAQDELRRIYNRASIFLAPSLSEGFPLPPCEAMMSGAAVVATDIGGHREFCFDNETALIVPPEDSEALAEAAARLIDNTELRYRIARTGHDRIQKFTWAAAIDSFERVLLESA